MCMSEDCAHQVKVPGRSTHEIQFLFEEMLEIGQSMVGGAVHGSKIKRTSGKSFYQYENTDPTKYLNKTLLQKYKKERSKLEVGIVEIIKKVAYTEKLFAPINNYKNPDQYMTVDEFMAHHLGYRKNQSLHNEKLKEGEDDYSMTINEFMEQHLGTTISDRKVYNLHDESEEFSVNDESDEYSGNDEEWLDWYAEGIYNLYHKDQYDEDGNKIIMAGVTIDMPDYYTNDNGDILVVFEDDDQYGRLFYIYGEYSDGNDDFVFLESNHVDERPTFPVNESIDDYKLLKKLHYTHIQNQ